jgi:copper transport protein
MRMRRLVAVLLGLAGAALLFAAPASAHAELVSSDPANGARLKTAPSSVSIRFDESVGLGGFGYLQVTDQDGTRVDTGPAAHPAGNDSVVTVGLRSGLKDGTFTESYRVVSADSHPIAGVVRFVVGAGPLVTTTAVATTTTAPGVAAVFDVARWVTYAGIALLGGAWLLLTIWPAGRDDRRARRLVWSGWGLAVVGAVAELLLEGAVAAGAPLTSILHPSLIDAVLHDDYGQLHCARLVLLALLAIVLGRALQPVSERHWLDDLFWPAGAGLALTIAGTGHALTTKPAWLSIVSDAVHIGAVATWAGGLAMLAIAVLPRREPGELREVLPTFSRVAFISVCAIAVTGTYQAWRGIASWRAIVDTEYGLLVLAKVAGFCCLLALGNLSRRVIQRRVHRPVVAYAMTDPVLDVAEPPGLDGVTVERMRRSVLVEVVVSAVVLALAAVLVSQPRGPEALAAQDRAPITASAPLGAGRSATVRVDPGEHGAVSVSVTVPASAREVTGTATEPDKRLGPIPLHLLSVGAGTYEATDVNLPVAGTWVISLVVSSSRFDAVTTQARVGLR